MHKKNIFPGKERRLLPWVQVGAEGAEWGGICSGCSEYTTSITDCSIPWAPFHCSALYAFPFPSLLLLSNVIHLFALPSSPLGDPLYSFPSGVMVGKSVWRHGSLGRQHKLASNPHHQKDVMCLFLQSHQETPLRFLYLRYKRALHLGYLHIICIWTPTGCFWNAKRLNSVFITRTHN